MSEIELILTKLKIVSEEKERGMYLCDKEHSKILLDYIQQKENIIKEVRELAIIKKARVENEPDYSKSYLEGYENAIQTQHLSHSGVMLETIKSTIKTTCNDFLEILDKEKI